MNKKATRKQKESLTKVYLEVREENEVFHHARMRRTIGNFYARLTASKLFIYKLVISTDKKL